MPSKKKVHLQQFDIIHLSNSDLTYIKNPERNKIMFGKLQEVSIVVYYILYFFFTPHL
jgi:hypothetical protein